MAEPADEQVAAIRHLERETGKLVGGVLRGGVDDKVERFGEYPI